MVMTDPIFLDFETEAIGPRPKEYPPKPVGLAVLDRTGQFETKYWAFGHDHNNNCTYETVHRLLQRIWESGRSICFHNAMFDMAVIIERFNLPFLQPERVHDTLVLAFLHDPYVRSLSLKELCVEWLGIQPEERDELFEWLVANIPAVAKKPKSAGAYIARGPADLVGKYALADVTLTAKLFDHTLEVREDMPEAYLREIELMPVLLENSMLGVRVDRDGLQACLDKANADILQCHQWLDKYFNVNDINYNSGAQLVQIIKDKGCYDKTKEWPTSAKGTALSDKDTLADLVTDLDLASVLRHRDVLVKLTGTYIEPWLAQSEGTGRIYTEWNTVRGEAGGTRTGRLSAKPTLQTMPTRGPKTPLPPEIHDLIIPKVRSFILPDEGHKMVACDFQAQELRLFAHFEDGKLAEQYRQDPMADLHTFAANLMTEKAGRPIIRDYAKTLSFGILYGAGPKKISEMLKITYTEAKQLVDLYKTEVASGLVKINDDLNKRYKLRTPFSTIGKRLVKGEPPKLINGKMMEFGFKSLNTLIQGSGADMAKKAMVDYYRIAENSRLLLSLHDELIITVQEDVVEREAKKLEHCMVHAFTLDVPLIAEAKVGNNFSEVK
jgi:DNA polymerase-1